MKKIKVSLFFVLSLIMILVTGCQQNPIGQLLGLSDRKADQQASADPTPNPISTEEDSIIEGVVHVRYGDAIAIPNPLTFKVTVTVMDQNNQKVADVNVESTGQFKLPVKPGIYTLISQPPVPNANALKAEPDQQTVSVESQEVKSVIIGYGVGIYPPPTDEDDAWQKASLVVAECFDECQTLTFTFHNNNTHASIALGNPAPWTIERKTDSGEIETVFQNYINSYRPVEVAPGEALKWNWDYRTNSRVRVKAGNYRINFDTGHLTAEFTVSDLK